MKRNRELEEIYDDYKRLKLEYNHEPLKGTGTNAEKDRLAYYNDKFTDLYDELRPICAAVFGKRTEHDDKAISAFKARVAKDLQEQDTKLSWNKVTELAAATEEYKDFIKERVYYYESWDSISHLRDSMKQYMINIGVRLSNM